MNSSPNIDDLLKAWDRHHKHGLEKTEERAVHDVMLFVVGETDSLKKVLLC